MVSLWVVNASPIILLSKAGLIDVLQHLGCPVVIPEAAAKEIQRRGPSDVSAQSLAQATWLATVDPGAIPPEVTTFGLGDGEILWIGREIAMLRDQTMNPDPNDIIRGLVEKWCERKEYGPLGSVLPTWLANNGLTDGWAMLHDALKTAYGVHRNLPPDERDALKQAYVAIDTALRNR